jgi:hypothetical protein
MAAIGRSARSALRLLASKPLARTAISRGYAAEGNEMAFTFAASNQVKAIKLCICVLRL